ncbi:MAG TPA: hypothetical protein ENK85_02920 [Saprospiraceae bacterium]|nr:hypothetical protein [Saprospiraceae bacterium]
MKKRLQSYVGVIACVLLPILGNAQFNFGLIGGVANYQGDVAKDLTDVQETHFALGGSLGYRISPELDIKAQIVLTKLSGNDANYTERQYRGFKFESNIVEFAGILDYYVLGSSTRSSTGVFVPKFTPLVYAGLGFTKVDNTAECFSSDCINNVIDPPFPEKDAKSMLFTVPFGLGFKYDASPLLAFGIRGGYRYSFSDYLDGISKAANEGKNDWYFVLGANVIFYIVPKETGGF